MNNDSFKANLGGASFITANTGEVTVAQQYPGCTIDITPPLKCYNFTPQDDATPVEAMYVSYYFAWFQSPGFSPSEMFPHWQIIKRHFTEVK